MTGERYTPITLGDMYRTLVNDMGFTQIDLANCYEAVFERQVSFKSGQSFPYFVRVYSSVDLRTEITRHNGKDAIRLVLRHESGRIIKAAEHRVYRTKNALETLKTRTRELFLQVANHRCPACTSVMVERTSTRGKFWGCSNYPECKYTIHIK